MDRGSGLLRFDPPEVRDAGGRVLRRLGGPVPVLGFLGDDLDGDEHVLGRNVGGSVPVEMVVSALLEPVDEDVGLRTLV